MTNPLLTDWDTPFAIAPFDRIADDDYGPAFEVALAAAQRDAETIAENPEAPTFANTIEALEASGTGLDRVLGGVLYGGRCRQHASTRGLAARFFAQTGRL